MSRERWFDLAVALGCLVLAGIFAIMGDSWLALIAAGLVSLYFFWKASRPDPPKWTTEGLSLDGPKQGSRMAPPGISGHNVRWLMVDLVPIRPLPPPYHLRLRATTRLREVVVMYLADQHAIGHKLDEADSPVTGGEVEVAGSEVTIHFRRPNFAPPARLRISLFASEDFQLDPAERRGGR